VRPAVEFGPIAPQSAPIEGIAIPGDPAVQSESCLTLNVWTPAPDEKRRPVMVWIHGGGFTTGSSSFLLYRGGDLARHGDVVVVTINYRLGALGFLGHRAVGEPGAAAVGNWGLMDQVAALEWVRDNIAGFGGDPDNVTVFGESAGAMSISTLLGVPAARGLFHRAIVESGPPYTHSLQRAERAGDDLAALLGFSEVRRDLLEKVPADELVAATQDMQNRPPPPGELPLPFLPVVDGSFLPQPPIDSVHAGGSASIPLLIGTTRDELSLFALGDPRLSDIDDDGLLSWMSRVAPQIEPAEFVAAYRSTRDRRGESLAPRDLWVGMGSDLVFRWPSLRLAAAQHRHQPRTYVYLFTWETPAFGGALGACHALEIPFVFGAVHRPIIAAIAGGGPDAEALSAQMQAAWISFARSGDPAHEGIGAWPAWDPQRRATMVFDRSSGAVDAPRDEELAVLAKRWPLDEAGGGPGHSH
jgi:para-nitrobenzyl esterase